MVDPAWIASLKLTEPCQRGSACTNLDLERTKGNITQEQYEWLAERKQWGWRADSGYKDDIRV